MAGISDIIKPGTFDPVSAGAGLVTGTISGLINQGFQKMQLKREMKAQKELMAQQHAYELENLNTQDQYQRRLAIDAAKMQKQGLVEAGYSTADPAGTGTSISSISGPSTSASAGAPSAQPGYMPGMTISDIASAHLTESQANLNKIQSQYLAKKLEGEIGLLNAQISEIKETLPEKVSNIKAQTDKLVADKKLSQEQANQVVEATKKITEEVGLLQIDKRYRADLNSWQVKKLEKEVSKLASEGKFEAVKAELADYGIIVGADWMTQLAAVIHKGTAGSLIDQIVDTVKQIFSKAGEYGPGIADSILNAIGKDDLSDEMKNRHKQVMDDYAEKQVHKMDSIRRSKE